MTTLARWPAAVAGFLRAHRLGPVPATAAAPVPAAGGPAGTAP
ncbi:hypothetical protein [Micromonospora sp. NPDC049497]